MNNFLTGCIGVCATGTLNLPALPANQDCFAESIQYSQVCGIVLLPDAVTPPADWTSAADWAGVIDNTNTDGTMGKYMTVEGGIDEPVEEEVEIPKRGTKVGSREYTLIVDKRFLDDLTYEFFRSAQCGDTGQRLWYETVGGRFFGGPNGIDIKSMKSTLPLGSGRDDFELGRLTIAWDADGDPERTATPF